MRIKPFPLTRFERILLEQRKTGPWQGPLPIESTMTQKDKGSSDHPGTPFCDRAIEALHGKDGTIELAQFSAESPKEFPENIDASGKLEADLGDCTSSYWGAASRPWILISSIFHDKDVQGKALKD